MDIPHVLNEIKVRYGLKGYKRESSTFSQKTDAVGLVLKCICLWLQGLKLCH